MLNSLLAVPICSIPISVQTTVTRLLWYWRKPKNMMILSRSVDMYVQWIFYIMMSSESVSCWIKKYVYCVCRCISSLLFDISSVLAWTGSRSVEDHYFCFEEQGSRSEEGSLRSHERGYARAAFTEVLQAETPPYWISVIDWTLQLIGLIWSITISLFHTGLETDNRLKVYHINFPHFHSVTCEADDSWVSGLI